MRKTLKISFCLAGVLGLAAALFLVVREAEQNRPYQTRKELSEPVEDTRPKAKDPRLQEALDNPEAFQSALLGEESTGEEWGISERPPEPGRAVASAVSVVETPGPEPLSEEASATRKARMGSALREFNFLRAPQYRDPDSELNRETLDKLAEMRRQRLAQRQQLPETLSQTE